MAAPGMGRFLTTRLFGRRTAGKGSHAGNCLHSLGFKTLINRGHSKRYSDMLARLALGSVGIFSIYLTTTKLRSHSCGGDATSTSPPSLVCNCCNGRCERKRTLSYQIYNLVSVNAATSANEQTQSAKVQSAVAQQIIRPTTTTTNNNKADSASVRPWHFDNPPTKQL